MNFVRKSLAEHQEMATKMDKERKELEMAIARSMVDQQRLEAQQKSQNDLMEDQMMKLSVKEPEGKDFNIDLRKIGLWSKIIMLLHKITLFLPNFSNPNANFQTI